MASDPIVVERLERLERDNHRLRTILRLNALGLVAAAALALAGFSRRTHVPAVVSADSLRLRELVVVDANGVARVRLGASLPDAVIGGRRVPRGDAAAGIMLYDRTGQERGGYATFDRSGDIALTLDTRKGQVALFAADADDGAAARLWRGNDWVEMRAEPAGTRFGVGRGGRVVVQEPPMTEAEGAVACKELKEELAQVKPAPPDSVVMAACRQHLTGDICRKCLDPR